MTTRANITSKSWLMVATLGLTWGGTFLVTELALEGITPFWLAAGRIGFAALLMTAIWQGLGGRLFAERPNTSALLSLAAIGGFSSAIPFMLLAWGQQFVTSGFAGVSMASVALIVLPLAHFFVPGERITWRKAAGFVIGFCGVCVLIGGQAFETSGAAMETAGRMACVSAACCYGISSVLMRRLPAIDPIGLSTVLLIIAAGITIPVAWSVEGPPPLPDQRTLIVIAFLGLVPTAAANILRVLVIRSAGPVFMSLTNYQVPVWSVVMGAVLLGEPLPPSLLWAMALILSGVGLSQYGALRRLFGRG
ncbi:DMT family transporter [Tateyamaria sp.]|uniref:DMT family transporter n=1 Tax=Tateyamaria sp. TaxID=1929288 RepID=UPI003B217BC6